MQGNDCQAFDNPLDFAANAVYINFLVVSLKNLHGVSENSVRIGSNCENLIPGFVQKVYTERRGRTKIRNCQ